MLTIIEHVSSVSKSTIESPPLASSALFGGRNRATTTEHVSLCPPPSYIAPFIIPLMVLPAFGALLEVILSMKVSGVQRPSPPLLFTYAMLKAFVENAEWGATMVPRNKCDRASLRNNVARVFWHMPLWKAKSGFRVLILS